jgi:glycosyltransferase involved in cell wall biosynthesis
MKLIFISHLAKNMLLFRSELLKELSSGGHEVIVVCPFDKDCHKFDDLGVKYIEWPFSRQGGIINVIGAIYSLVRTFRDIRPDRVICYMIQPILLGTIASLGVKVDLTCVFTGLGTVFINKSKFKERVRFRVITNALKMLLIKSRRVIVLNKDDYYEVSKLCPKSKLFRLSGEGVDLERFEYENLNKEKIEEFRLLLKPKGEKVVLYLGRFIKEKGIHDFYEIANKFIDKNEISFVAVGECDHGNPSSLNPDELRELKNIARVVDWNDWIPEILYNTDLMLYPSQREGFPVGLMEALASGIPVVGYDVPGVRDALAGFSDFLVENKSDMVEFVKSEKKWDKNEIRNGTSRFEYSKIHTKFKKLIKLS